MDELRRPLLGWEVDFGAYNSCVGVKSTLTEAPSATVVTMKEEAVIFAFRRHTLLPLDECFYAP